MNSIKEKILSALFICIFASSFGQEIIFPRSDNPVAKAWYSNQPALTKSAKEKILELPLVDDFSGYLVEPDPDIWSDRNAFINQSYGVDPVTIGVATLDAIDYDGSIYGNATIDPTTFIADTLTSHPINLAYPASDSIYLSFFYQPQGLGEVPESQDSLMVQFFDLQNNKWNTVWQIPGDSLHPFKQVMIPITDGSYLVNGFKFRFKNLASLSRSKDYPDFRGNVDHWNIDYVRLDRFRSISDTILRDVAFTQPLPSILKGLEALPWKHFQTAYNTALNSKLPVRYRNNDSITRNVTRTLTAEDLLYDEQHSTGQPTAQDIPAFEDTVVQFEYIYPFDFDRGHFGLFKFKASLRTDVFDRKTNDTVYRIQEFKDYYAYDDGTAEFGYGIRGQGSKNGMVALKYNVFQPDHIAGVDVYFNQIYDSINLNYYFRFVVWNDNEGQPGEIIYRDEKSHRPVYADSLNRFTRFIFEEPVPVNGITYVGWTQVDEYLLNIGLDINNKPAGPTLFYNLGSGWTESNAPGIIMLRPFMRIWPLENHEEIKETIRIYPNPAGEIVFFELDQPGNENLQVEIYDTGGRLVMKREIPDRAVDISEIEEGLYIIRMRTGSSVHTTKLIISR